MTRALRPLLLSGVLGLLFLGLPVLGLPVLGLPVLGLPFLGAHGLGLHGLGLHGQGLLQAPAVPAGNPDWRTCSPELFEELVQGIELAVAGGEPAVLPGEIPLEAVTVALDEPGPAATRAAVLLGWVAFAAPAVPPPSAAAPSAAARSAAARAEAALLARLERRQPEPSRALDAGDVIAAAAMARLAPDPERCRRLATLADGPEMHPDLEVRVECAGAALLGGRREVLPFLLRVLRARTLAEPLDPPDWPWKRSLTWAKSRAAEILSREAGVPCAFRADGSFEHQAREADALEAALSR